MVTNILYVCKSDDLKHKNKYLKKTENRFLSAGLLFQPQRPKFWKQRRNCCFQTYSQVPTLRKNFGRPEWNSLQLLRKIPPPKSRGKNTIDDCPVPHACLWMCFDMAIGVWIGVEFDSASIADRIGTVKKRT